MVTDDDARPFQLEHEIFVLDAFLRNPLDPASRRNGAATFIRELLQTLAMSPLGAMQFHDAEDERAPGWSFLQAITTSHVSCHYFEKPGRLPHIRIDIYSCKSVDWRNVVAMSNRHFALDDWHATFIHRTIDEPGRRVLDIIGHGADVHSIADLANDASGVAAEVTSRNIRKHAAETAIHSPSLP